MNEALFSLIEIYKHDSDNGIRFFCRKPYGKGTMQTGVGRKWFIRPGRKRQMSFGSFTTRFQLFCNVSHLFTRGWNLQRLIYMLCTECLS